eukprot:516468-Prymnesium_polylepis.1
MGKNTEIGCQFFWLGAPLPCPTCTLHHSTSHEHVLMHSTAHGEVRVGFARRWCVVGLHNTSTPGHGAVPVGACPLSRPIADW